MSEYEQEHQSKNPLLGEPAAISGDAPKAEYQIGYKRPPVHTRFQPGQSGNPKGRPAGRPNAKTTVERVINEKVPVRQGENTRHMTKFEAMVQAQTMKGMKGDARSAHIVFGLITRMGLLGDLESETLAVLPSDEHLDFNKIPLEKVRRFRDLLRKGIDPTALSHDDLDELHEIKRSTTETKD